ncbi:hypothetical protein PR202_gb09312 [Eleusine coracana subsp. coracana]|uniref:Pseudouridine synthase I TruA alpha/beta domain-containing protein n=1 Tax=Eleusine coracana subsp. coracana TaxID=191504 RepID=A0AAV5EHY3_ELECO|nr:hypothetical protein PR202_gb09312 [Eleusine coracana subsp. coracana]
MAAASPPPSPPQAKRPKMSSSSDPEGAESGQPRRRYKRRKVAILLGYCGAGYQGMQKNPGARTIEGDLEEALYHAGAVPEADRAAPRRYDWARAARTDKGVSAAAQVVSGRFYVDPPGFTDRLNAQLAPQIRAFGYVRVTNSFNAKKFCDRRRYVYLLPVFALNPSAHPDREAVMASMGSGTELAKCLECSERGRKVPGVMGREGKVPSPGGNDVDAPMEEAVAGLDDSGSTGDAKCGSVSSVGDNANGGDKIDSSANEKLDLTSADVTEAEKSELRLNGVEKCDTMHSGSSAPVIEEEKLHAMDVEKSYGEEMPPKKSDFSYTDEVKERFNRILKFYVGTHNFHNFTTRTKAEDPAAKRCEVIGQSFMLHQIRKMIGLAVAVMRNCAPESIYDVAFRKDVNINVPTAPEVGLYLDECMFTSYNKKWKDSHEAVSMEPYWDDAEEFRNKYIFPHIAAMEHKEGAVALWLHSLNHRNYPDFRYMDNAGTEVKVGAEVESIKDSEVRDGAEVESIKDSEVGDGAEVESIKDLEVTDGAEVESIKDSEVRVAVEVESVEEVQSKC